MHSTLMSTYDRHEQGYEVAKVWGVDAFGPNLDHPVLKLDLDNWHEHRDTKIMLNKAGISYATNWAFNPHVTVDLKTVVNPPKKVLLRPLELWWGSDEPVVV